MGVIDELAIILGLTVVNAFFSGAEIAVLSVRKSRLQELLDEGHGAARKALELRQNPEQFLATVQVGITVVGATAGAFGGAVLERPIAEALKPLGAGRYADQLALAIVVAIVSFLSIVIGELVPKSLALRSSERFALFASPILLVIARLARPVVWFLTAASNIVLRPFHDSTTFTESRLSPDELQQLVEEAAATGSLDANAGEIASRAIDLGKLRVNALMIPRTAMVCVQKNATTEQVRALLTEHHHARFPVIESTHDEVLGYVTARELYEQLTHGEVDVPAAMRAVPFFPEQISAIDALRALQRAHTHLGVIVDELGSVSGLVAIEDISEELIGEVFAETDRPDPQVRGEGPGVFVVRGDTPVHEVNREIGVELPTGPSFTTLAGLLLFHTGAIPQRGQRISLPDGIEAEIIEATPRQVRVVRISTPQHHTAAG